MTTRRLSFAAAAFSGALAVLAPPTLVRAEAAPAAASRVDDALEELHWLLFDGVPSPEADARAERLWHELRATGLSMREIVTALSWREFAELERQGYRLVPLDEAELETWQDLTDYVDAVRRHQDADPAAVEPEAAPEPPPPAPELSAWPESPEAEDYDDGAEIRFALRSVAWLPKRSPKLGLSPHENPTMFGAGLSTRLHWENIVALEVSTDFLTGSAGDVRQFQMPVLFSLLYYPLGEPGVRSTIQPYVQMGLGLQIGIVHYQSANFTHSFVEGLLTTGMGIDFQLSERWRLHTEALLVLTLKDEDWQNTLASACAKSPGASAAGMCANTHSAGISAGVNYGGQFMVGLAFAF